MINIRMNELQILEPLIKWRILDLKTLKRESSYQSGYVSFCKKILRLEKLGIVKKAIDKFTGIKYVFLSALGKKYVAGSESYECIAEGHERHDLISVYLLRYFQDYSRVNHCLVEQEIKQDKKFRSKDQIIPDGLIEVKTINEEVKNISLEVELTRKSKDRIKKKYEQYLNDKNIDMTFWFFASQSVLNSYQKYFKELHGKEVNKFVYFLICENKLLDLKVMNIQYLGKDKEIKDFEGLIGGKTV